MMAQSVWREGDLDLRDNFSRGDHLEYLGGYDRMPGGTRRADGRSYPTHSAGLSVLLAPAYALGGRRACVVLLALVAAGLGLLVRDLARRSGADEASALVAWAATVGPPVLYYTAFLYTEVAAAFAIALALRLLLFSPGPVGRGRRRARPLGAAVAPRADDARRGGPRRLRRPPVARPPASRLPAHGGRHGRRPTRATSTRSSALSRRSPATPRQVPIPMARSTPAAHARRPLRRRRLRPPALRPDLPARLGGAAGRPPPRPAGPLGARPRRPRRAAARPRLAQLVGLLAPGPLHDPARARPRGRDRGAPRRRSRPRPRPLALGARRDGRRARPPHVRGAAGHADGERPRGPAPGARARSPATFRPRATCRSRAPGRGRPPRRGSRRRARRG